MHTNHSCNVIFATLDVLSVTEWKVILHMYRVGLSGPRLTGTRLSVRPINWPAIIWTRLSGARSGVRDPSACRRDNQMIPMSSFRDEQVIEANINQQYMYLSSELL